eukprot:113495_1
MKVVTPLPQFQDSRINVDFDDSKSRFPASKLRQWRQWRRLIQNNAQTIAANERKMINMRQRLKHYEQNAKQQKAKPKIQRTLSIANSNMNLSRPDPNSSVSGHFGVSSLSSIVSKKLDLLAKRLQQNKVSSLDLHPFYGKTAREIVVSDLNANAVLIVQHIDLGGVLSVLIYCAICSKYHDCSKRSRSTMCCRQHAFVLTLEEFSNETGGTQLIKALHRHYHILPHHKSFEQAYYDHDTNDRVLTYCQCRDVYQIVRSKAANKTIESNSLSKSELGLSGNKNLCYHRVNLIVGGIQIRSQEIFGHYGYCVKAK